MLEMSTGIRVLFDDGAALTFGKKYFYILTFSKFNGLRGAPQDMEHGKFYNLINIHC